MSNALLLAPAEVGPRMAGPGIRFLELAKQLHLAGHRVVLGSVDDIDHDFAAQLPFELFKFHRLNLPDKLNWAGVVIIQGMVLRRHQFLKKAGRPLVIDLYDPIFMETLAHYRLDSDKGRTDHNLLMGQMLDMAVHGDFFLCASEKQRDMWLGFLAACNRINPATYADDKTLRRLIDLVPFGIPDQAPEPVGPGLRSLPGIRPDDRVILWNGGVWDWMSPEPLVEAVGLLNRRSLTDRPVKLVFMGVKNPNSDLPESGALTRTRGLINKLGLGDQVILNDWVKYQERTGFLLQADLAACLYPPGLETDYSFRTRFLDCIWAGLPFLCSGGDAIGQLAAREHLGVVVDSLDPELIADGIADFLNSEDITAGARENLDRVAADLAWSRAARPLIDFCNRPRQAADKGWNFPIRPKAALPVSYYAKRVIDHCRQGTLLSAVIAPGRIKKKLNND